MSLLSDRDIERAMEISQISVSPYLPENLQPASIDVRLSNEVWIFEDWATQDAVDPHEPHDRHQYKVTLPENVGMVLEPGQFILGSTIETITLQDNLGARFEGKSSIGRLGLLTHVTAGFIDPGFSGQITLELCNLRQRYMQIWPGMKVGQICFYDLTSRAVKPYGKANNHYQGQRGPTPSQAHLQFQKGD